MRKFLDDAGKPIAESLQAKVQVRPPRGTSSKNWPIITLILQTMVRDGFKCALTGYHDRRWLRDLTFGATIPEGAKETWTTECLHLVPLWTDTINYEVCKL